MGPQGKFHFSDWAGEEPIGRESNRAPFLAVPSQLPCAAPSSTVSKLISLYVSLACSVA